MKKLNQKFRKKFISRLRKIKKGEGFRLDNAILSAAGIPCATIKAIPDDERGVASLQNFVKVVKVDRHRAGIRTLTSSNYAPKGYDSIYTKLNDLALNGKSANYIAAYVERYL